MRLIILINSLRSGGAERQLTLLCKALPITSLVVFDKGQFYSYGETPIVKCSSYVALFFYFITLRRSDIVLSFLPRANYLNILLSLMFGYSAIISERTTPTRAFRCGVRKLHYLCIRLLYPCAKHIIVNSLGVHHDLTHHFNIKPKNISVIQNAFDIGSIRSYIDSSGSERSVADMPKRLLTIGRCDDSKAFSHIIRVFSRVRRSLPMCKLVIIGDGYLRVRLEALARSYGLAQDVSFLGIKKNPFSYIYQADLFLLPSLFEGFPNVLVEAMTCGTAVMSSDCRSGPREILAPDTYFTYETKVPEYAKYGILMPVFDGKWRSADEPLTKEEQVWADEIINILKNENLLQTYSYLGKQRANDFTIEKIIPQWKSLLDTL